MLGTRPLSFFNATARFETRDHAVVADTHEASTTEASWENGPLGAGFACGRWDAFVSVANAAL